MQIDLSNVYLSQPRLLCFVMILYDRLGSQNSIGNPTAVPSPLLSLALPIVLGILLTVDCEWCNDDVSFLCPLLYY